MKLLMRLRFQTVSACITNAGPRRIPRKPLALCRDAIVHVKKGLCAGWHTLCLNCATVRPTPTKEFEAGDFPITSYPHVSDDIANWDTKLASEFVSTQYFCLVATSSCFCVQDSTQMWTACMFISADCTPKW